MRDTLQVVEMQMHVVLFLSSSVVSTHPVLGVWRVLVWLELAWRELGGQELEAQAQTSLQNMAMQYPSGLLGTERSLLR